MSEGISDAVTYLCHGMAGMRISNRELEAILWNASTRVERGAIPTVFGVPVEALSSGWVRRELERGPRLISTDFGKDGGAFCISVPQPGGSLVVEKAGEIGTKVGPEILGAALAFGSPRSGKTYEMLLTQAQEWEEQLSRCVKWEKLMGGCWAASIVKEDENVREFVVGTKVRITATEDDIPKIKAEGWWNPRGKMEPCLGRIGVVTCRWTNRIMVKIDGECRSWFWAPWALEVMKEDKNVSEKKIGVSEIEFDHVWDDEKGEMFKIVDIRGVSNEAYLPKAYVRGSPAMFGWRDIVTGLYKGDVMQISVGTILSPERLALVMRWMKASGERLHKIRQAEKDAERREKWISKGRRTVRI